MFAQHSNIDAGVWGLNWAVQGEVAMLALHLVVLRPRRSATRLGMTP